MVATITRDKDGHLVLQKRDDAGKVTLSQITPEQSKAWEQTLSGYAKQVTGGSVNDLLARYDVAVPDEAGDSQYGIGYELGLSDKQIANEVIPLNGFENPDLIHLYHAGDTEVDFVVAPKMNGREPEVPDKKVATYEPTAEPPADVVKSLTGTKDPAQREAMIRNVIGQENKDGPLGNVLPLLEKDYGEDNGDIKRQVVDNYLNLYRDADEPTKKKAVDDLLEKYPASDSFIVERAKAANFPYSPEKVQNLAPDQYKNQSPEDFAKTLGTVPAEQRGTMVRIWLLGKDGKEHNDLAVNLAKQDFAGIKDKDGKPLFSEKEANDIRQTIFRTRIELIPKDGSGRLDAIKDMAGKSQDGKADYWVDYALAKAATSEPFNFKLDDIGDLNDDAKNDAGKK